jgi:hypothetical protein
MDCYKDKLSKTIKIRNDIKKKKILIDETRECFGGDSLVHLKDVRMTSIKGHPMVYTNNTIGKKFGVKVMTVERDHDTLESPSYIEYILLKSLSDSLLKSHTPHIVNYLGVCNVSNKCKAVKPLNLRYLESQGLVKSKSIVLLSEFLEGESLYDWSYATENDDIDAWKGIVFQIVYTIHVLQKKFKLMHNDFHYGNVLMDTTELNEEYFCYNTNGVDFYVKNINSMPKVWDFEYAHAFDYPKNIKNALIFKDDNKIPTEFNNVYDVHFFLTSLLELRIPRELRLWILKVFPIESISASDQCTHSATTKDSLIESSETSSSCTDSYYSDSSESSSCTDSYSSSSSSCTDSYYSESDSSSSSSSSSESSDESEEFLFNKRLRIGVEKTLKLPTPTDILLDSFFDSLKLVPKTTNMCKFLDAF